MSASMQEDRHHQHHDHSAHHCHHDHKHQSQHEGAAKEAGSNVATDPVCGMQVRVKEGVRSEQYDGESYYFCSDGC